MPTLTPLSSARCERLLRAGVFGRAGLNTPDGPEIVPVNYAVVDDAIVIRTEPTSLLARHSGGQPLVFEVDLVDHERWQGWSVVARGLGVCVVEGDATGPPVNRPRPWPEGKRTAIVRLAWDTLSGRRLGSGRDELSAMPVQQVLR